MIFGEYRVHLDTAVCNPKVATPMSDNTDECTLDRIECFLRQLTSEVFHHEVKDECIGDVPVKAKSMALYPN